MSLYLYGVIASEDVLDFGAIGFDGLTVHAIPHGSFSGVVGPSPNTSFTGQAREELVKLLLAHQRTLETIMKRHFVLPFKFGTTIGDESELRQILQDGEKFLTSLEAKVKETVEIDLVAVWDVLKMCQEVAEEDPEITACKREMAQKNKARSAVEGEAPSGLAGGGGDASPHDDRAFVGMLLAQALKRRADRWRHHITEGLRSCATASAGHDLLNDQMILNNSFLIGRGEEGKFYHAVDELNLHFKERLHFKCVGPLPPYSFATITLRRFDPEEVRRSAKILGLNSKAELTLVKKAYKELSRKCHPDTDPNLSVEKFEELNRAYKILVDYCKDGPRPLAGEAIEKYVQLKVIGNLNQARSAVEGEAPSGSAGGGGDVSP